jgi:hypothetical protein
MAYHWQEVATGGGCVALSSGPLIGGGEVLLTDGDHHAPQDGKLVHIVVLDAHGEEARVETGRLPDGPGRSRVARGAARDALPHRHGRDGAVRG